jgi:hypothetical protein
MAKILWNQDWIWAISDILNGLNLNELKGYYLIYSTSLIYRLVATILFLRNGTLGREQTGGMDLFAHGCTMTVDRGSLKLALRWMSFGDVSFYRIMERWGSHLRRFYGTWGGGLGWRRRCSTLSGGWKLEQPTMGLHWCCSTPVKLLAPTAKLGRQWFGVVAAAALLGSGDGEFWTGGHWGLLFIGGRVLVG